MEFSIENVAKTVNFQKTNRSKSQLDYYLENNSAPETIVLVKLNNKTFGEKMQRILIELLNLEPPTSTGHDARLGDLKFEIKTSRYWVSLASWKWQHIMLDHEYDYLLLVGVDFNQLKIYIISKPKYCKALNDGLANVQGNANGQGTWANYKKIRSKLHRVQSKQDFLDYLNR